MFLSRKSDYIHVTGYASIQPAPVISGAAKQQPHPLVLTHWRCQGPLLSTSPTWNRTATGSLLYADALVSVFKMFLRRAVDPKSTSGGRNTKGSQVRMHLKAALVHVTHGENKVQGGKT